MFQIQDHFKTSLEFKADTGSLMYIINDVIKRTIQGTLQTKRENSRADICH